MYVGTILLVPVPILYILSYFHKTLLNKVVYYGTV